MLNKFLVRLPVHRTLCTEINAILISTCQYAPALSAKGIPAYLHREGSKLPWISYRAAAFMGVLLTGLRLHNKTKSRYMCAWFGRPMSSSRVTAGQHMSGAAARLGRPASATPSQWVTVFSSKERSRSGSGQGFSQRVTGASAHCSASTRSSVSCQGFRSLQGLDMALARNTRQTSASSSPLEEPPRWRLPRASRSGQAGTRNQSFHSGSASAR